MLGHSMGLRRGAAQGHAGLRIVAAYGHSMGLHKGAAWGCAGTGAESGAAQRRIV